MLTSLASNAIVTKALAMYGKRLHKEDYHALLNCHSVAEVTNYLKNQTAYRTVLSGINANQVHRGQLEMYLRQKFFEDYASLCRYELTMGEHFADYLLIQNEIDQILHSVVLLMAKRSEEYLLYIPAYLSQHTKIDLVSLSHLKSYKDLLNALGTTPYRALMEPFTPSAGVPLDYTGIENALYSYLYRRLFDIIEHYTKGENEQQLKELFYSFADLTNLVRIIRLKQTYHEGPDYIRSLLMPYSSIPSSALENMLGASDEEVLKIFEHTRAGRRISQIKYAYLDQVPLRVRFKICRHNLRFSTHASVVMISYIFLAQAELMDIINIIEGIRYQLAPADIKPLLTAADYQ